MTMFSKDKRRSQAGVALVEFALVVPLLALLLVGIIEIGRYAYFSIAVGNAARAGAQYGIYDTTRAVDIQGMEAAAIADGQNNIKAISATANDVCTCWNSTTGTESPNPPTHAQCGPPCTSGQNVTYVEVDTTGNFSSMFSYPIFPSTFTVSAKAIMRVHP